MPDFAHTTRHLLLRLLGAPSPSVGPYAGIETVLDGITAVAVTEASIAETAGLGTTFPSDLATLVWRSEQLRRGANLLGGTLSSQRAEGPRGAMAAALGQAMAGSRATVFVSGPDLAGAQDLLAMAAGRRLPLVLHLCNRALPAQADALGSGHEACHLSADSGAFLLVAANVQEAVDFSLIARRVAESALAPGLVVMDGESTALAAQDVRLPPAELVREFLGLPQDSVPAPTTAQALLFGDQRRRIPRWHDLDRPVLQGGLQGVESWALGKAASTAYFYPQVEPALADAFTQFAALTGRHHAPISTYRTHDARLVLVIQGAAVETAEAVADYVRETYKIKAGVLGIRCLRPFPGARIAACLAKTVSVAVLERLDTPLAGEAPLMRELRASIDRALENRRFGPDTHPDYPALKEKDRPRLRSVVYGLGGFPLRAADLIAFCRQSKEMRGSRVYLGLDFAHTSSLYPKRQVLLDRLRRAYPQNAKLGLRASMASPDLRPPSSLTLALHRIAGHGGEGLAPEAASFVHQLRSGQVRSHPALVVAPSESYCVDRFTSAPQSLRDPGNEMPIDLSVVISTADSSADYRVMHPTANLRQGGALLIPSALSDEAQWQSLPSHLRETIQSKEAALYCVPRFGQLNPPELRQERQARLSEELGREHLNEHWLGGLIATLVASGMLNTTVSRAVKARDDSLQGLPKAERLARLNFFERAVEAVREIKYHALHASEVDISRADPSPARDDDAPWSVRQLGHADDAYDSLPRFWDQLGVLYQSGETEALSVDPYLATGTIPPLTSTLRDLSDLCDRLPVLDPQACTGCGECWTLCPDAAIGAKSFTPGVLLDWGIRVAGVEALRPLASRLATRIISLCSAHTQVPPTQLPPTAGALLNDAYAQLEAKLSLPEERKKTIGAGLAALNAAVGIMPVAITEPFFHAAEGEAQSTGELLVLAINPDACKGCGLCVANCEGRALSSATGEGRQLDEARNRWKLWEHLPETGDSTIARVGTRTEVGPMAAALLWPGAQFVVAGGDGAEAGSGEKLALRLTMAAAESQQRPLVDEFLKDIVQTRDALAKRIRETLADAVPAEDLDALAQTLEGVPTRQVELSLLSRQTDAAIAGGRVDAERLRSFVDLARQLGDLHWRYSQGRQGLGRARMGLAVAPGTAAAWTGAFPFNAFRLPVTVDATGDTAELATGLLEGQLRQATEALVLLRKARLEVEQPAEAVRRRVELNRMSWRDLNANERRLCPPVLLVGKDDLLGGQGLAQVAWLLGSDLPVKILVLVDLDLGVFGRARPEMPVTVAENPRINLGLSAIAQRNAYVAQTSIANGSHFIESIQAAFAYTGPALIQVHAPSPARHGFATERTLDQARLAVLGRVFPLFQYDPEGEGVFGSRLSLEANPQPRAFWARDSQGRPFNPADWALGERRYAALFKPIKDDTASLLNLDEYLELESDARLKKTPVATLKTTGSESVHYEIDAALVGACEERLHAWRILQELAGLVTPFTARVEQEAETKLFAAHQAELATLKEEYERRIQGLGAQLQTEMAGRIQGRLMRLAGYESGDAAAHVGK